MHNVYPLAGDIIEGYNFGLLPVLAGIKFRLLGEARDMDVHVKEEFDENDLAENNFEVKDEPNDMCTDDKSTDEYDIFETLSESEDDIVEGEAELLGRFSPDILKPLPTKQTLRNNQFFKELEILKDKVITAHSIKSLIEPAPKSEPSKIYITEKVAHVVNVSTILEHSNLTAFKTKRRAGYPCFYCSRICDSFDQLHDHQMHEKCRRNIKKILDKIPAESLVVYVHITEIKCTICDQTITNLNELKLHLNRIHKKKLYAEFGDRIIPFKLTKLNQYECFNCGFNFETFGAIERHMNTHYRNYVCDQCGAGYVTKNRLKVHLKYSHVRGNFPCDVCKKTFYTQYKYKSHVDAVHKMVKKNKCPKCPERFSDYFDRHKHMVDAHGDPPLRYRCNVCDSLFKRRYALSCHMKRRHLDVKDIECGLCSYKCYTGTELKAHMVKHNGERTYVCVICKKSYARKKTLKEHARIHNNDKRFVCVVCGQAFVQNCSLKGHMKSHHIDYMNKRS
ncbi:gastrula zinc finger protein XlCGF26.1-like isoform X2 [Pararge aegeria]|uniref:gastrula zinc finger protein XlCGF26.1-like isoform X2 n=1 Tax=Pararge aegeria TaxID=116150 RepID=UPI0019D26F32|nr:gastrula zinc finger protein XlCGF26.1-like isoform X2 [Pararge aegeria]